ncbi:Rhotekin [Anabarilius grahami]|uniref:Rhotekin n=1 Tax=Anabarilius grahami TaxID=495550 RepID=A0A3N0YZF4_ANAGA|nr:Rhotekin [Anabarilius grahami]
MFCRNQTARATIARGSALEMEIRRGKFRQSVFMETPQHVSRAARPQRTMRNLSALGPKQEHMLLDLNEGPWQKALLRGTGEEDNRPRSDVIEASLFLVSMPGTLEP